MAAGIPIARIRKNRKNRRLLIVSNGSVANVATITTSPARPTYASQRICCRSSPDERRNRTISATSEAIAATSEPEAAHREQQVPQPRRRPDRGGVGEVVALGRLQRPSARR